MKKLLFILPLLLLFSCGKSYKYIEYGAYMNPSTGVIKSVTNVSTINADNDSLACCVAIKRFMILEEESKIKKQGKEEYYYPIYFTVKDPNDKDLTDQITLCIFSIGLSNYNKTK